MHTLVYQTLWDILNAMIIGKLIVLYMHKSVISSKYIAKLSTHNASKQQEINSKGNTDFTQLFKLLISYSLIIFYMTAIICMMNLFTSCLYHFVLYSGRLH